MQYIFYFAPLALSTSICMAINRLAIHIVRESSLFIHHLLLLFQMILFICIHIESRSYSYVVDPIGIRHFDRISSVLSIDSAFIAYARIPMGISM